MDNILYLSEIKTIPAAKGQQVYCGGSLWSVNWIVALSWLSFSTVSHWLALSTLYVYMCTELFV